MKFKIDSKLIKAFLELIKTDEYPIEITQEGWKVNYPNREQHMFMSATLKATSFLEYPTVQDSIIVVPNNDFLINYLSRFEGAVQITYQDKQLLLSSENKTGVFRLGNVTDQEMQEMMERTKRKLKVEYDRMLKLPVGIFQNSIKDSALLKIEKYKLEVKDNILTISVGTNEHTLTEQKKVDYPNASCLYGGLIKEVFSTLEGEVEIGLKDNYPLRVSKQDKSYTITYTIAPMVEPVTN